MNILQEEINDNGTILNTYMKNGQTFIWHREQKSLNKDFVLKEIKNNFGNTIATF